MKIGSSKQPTDKKPVVVNSELWREIPDGLQEKVCGGWGTYGSDIFGRVSGAAGDDF